MSKYARFQPSARRAKAETRATQIFTGFLRQAAAPGQIHSEIAGLAHAALLGVNRHRLYHAVHSFLTMPERIDINFTKSA